MKKILIFSTVLLFTFIACQKRACHQTQTYNGLYNAITCDYKSQTFNLEQNLSSHEVIIVELQKKKNSLESKIYLQEDQLNYQKEQLKDKELLLKEIKKEVDNINTKAQTKEVLENLNLQIKNMHQALTK